MMQYWNGCFQMKYLTTLGLKGVVDHEINSDWSQQTVHNQIKMKQKRKQN